MNRIFLYVLANSVEYKIRSITEGLANMTFRDEILSKFCQWMTLDDALTIQVFVFQSK
jgi:hypothetical protein